MNIVVGIDTTDMLALFRPDRDTQRKADDLALFPCTWVMVRGW